MAFKHRAIGMTMEVRVKLMLRGGHGWEFCCKDGDPIVLGLISALPGADITGNLPPDGLVQIETRTGERLFLTRSSLVSVEIVPVANPLTFLGIKRLAAPSASFPTGASVPSPFVLANDMLPDDVHPALIAHVLSQDAEAVRSHSGMRELDLGPLEEPVAKALRSQLARGVAILDIPDQAEVELRLRLFAIGDAQAVSWEPNPADVLYMMYHFYKQPKGFTGGGIRLFDGRTENGIRPAMASFRDVEIGNNDMLIFPEKVVGAGLPVRCPTRAFADGLFVVRGIMRRGPASE
jgi:SM-20-related protein